MKILSALVLLAVMAACGSSEGSGGTGEPTAPELQLQTCEEVRAGIKEFNDQNYPGTVKHFEKAKVTAKVYAKISDAPEADELLDAVEYYANLAPADYPEAARTSQSFARNKEITLGQCADPAEPLDDGTLT